MNSNSQHIPILFLQNDKMNWIPANRQTQKNRDQTNLKIRELGDKFYTVKRIFDRLKIKRDTLFFFGKILECQYKYQKNFLHLQTQQRRMKESLICWYTQNFYTEILQPNSIILEKLLTFNNKTFYPYIKNTNNKKAQTKSNRKAVIHKINTPNSYNKNQNKHQMNNISIILDNQEYDEYNHNEEIDDILPPKEQEHITFHKNEEFENFSISTNESYNNEIDQDNFQKDQNNQMNYCLNQNIEINYFVQNIQNIYQNPQNTQNTDLHNLNPIGNASLFRDIKINQEVDDFENGNIVNHHL